MKWFQVDSDTPDDPRMRDVIRELGPAGFGGLFLLWCHIANHGAKRPGWSLRTDGKPMPESELMEAAKLPPADFARLVAICVENGHFLAREWVRRKVIAIPAMDRRADTYTKRRVRTRVEHASKDVPPQDSTNNTRHTNTPLTPRNRGAAPRLTRALRKRAEEVRRIRMGCVHDPRCPNAEACVLAIAAELQQKGGGSHVHH